MNNVSLNYAIWLLLILGGAVLMIVILRRGSDRIKRLTEEAEARGWSFERPNRRTFRICGVSTGNVAWTTESIDTSSADPTSGGSTENCQARWSSQAVSLPDRLILIGPQMPTVGTLPSTMEGGGLAGTLIRAFLRKVFGPDADRLAGMSQVQVGSEAFQRRYMVYAHDIQDVLKLLGVGIDAVLADLPKKDQLVIRLGGGELSILFLGLKLTSIAQVEQMVNLGERLVTTWQSSR